MARQMLRTWLAATAFLLTLWAVTATAQGTVNPTGVAFTSPSHDAVFLAQPVVSRYDLEVYAVGASSPMTTTDLGRGEKQATGELCAGETPCIKATPAVLVGLPIGQEFFAHVVAVGPGGQARSETPSDPFGRLAPPVAPGRVRVTTGS